MPLTTLTLFGYSRPSDKAWAFLQMAFARPALMWRRGLHFWKLVGCGKGSTFTLNADWGRYGLIAVWDTPADADRFFESRRFRAYERHADEIWTVKLIPLASQGAWSGRRLFEPDGFVPPPGSPLAVLTRALIYPNKLGRFWRHVPAANRAMEAAPGLLASIGMSEMPLLHMATFSLWANDAAMRGFAYATPQHRDVIRKTHGEHWYAESLFARFHPAESRGTWNGRDPLAQALSDRAVTSATF